MPSDDYFGGYSRTDIHAEMIGDQTRTRAYRRAIFETPELFEGKVVLDVGCGTGILSLFAAEAGAKHVYAVEASDMAEVARQVVEDNGLSSVITVLKGSLEDLIPPQKVDVIISEWMGYALLFEGMMQSVLVARDHWMKEGGTLVPKRARLYACAVEDFEVEAKRFAWWDSVYGFDMAAVADHSRHEPLVDTVDPHALVTDSAIIADIDLHTVGLDDNEHFADVELIALRTETVHAILLWFDVDLTNEVVLSTSPLDVPTHWKQTLFYLPNPLKVNRGDAIRLQISIAPTPHSPRGLDIQIDVAANGRERSSSYRM
ncbi:MAG: 50S ribosomal protein L11 methyltransferase [Alphaproteobacteria bacterium]|nr:50S ribosomal protein L11 methyltransferase [Alphaproteobacteria bacterium]